MYKRVTVSPFKDSPDLPSYRHAIWATRFDGTQRILGFVGRAELPNWRASFTDRDERHREIKGSFVDVRRAVREHFQ